MDGRDVFVADRYLHQHHVQALSLWISIHRCKHYITDITSAKPDVPQTAQKNWRLENQPPLHL